MALKLYQLWNIKCETLVSKNHAENMHQKLVPDPF